MSEIRDEIDSLQAALHHHQAGRVGEATALYRRILANEPANPTALHLLGVILGAAEDPSEGADLLERYLELVPDDPFARHSLGTLRERQGDHAGAIELFHRAILLKPDFALGYRSLGEVLRQAQRLDEAEVAFACALTLTPDDALVHNGLGDLRYAQGRFEEAVAEFQQAVELDPGLATAQCNRGIVLVELERDLEAIYAYRRALVIDPGCIPARLNLADALERAHLPEEARHHRIEAATRRGTIIEPCRHSPAESRILFLCGSGNSGVPIDLLFDRNRFTRILTFLIPNGVAERPAYDIAFNAIADPDRNQESLNIAADEATEIDVPLLNQPAQIARTRRDMLCPLLAGIDGLIVPETKRLIRTELLARLDHNQPVETPLLIRPVGSHGGHGLARIETNEELAAYLRDYPHDAFYLTRYVETADEQGYYRKYRFIFVDGQVFPYHLAIMKHWMVHYWRADMDEAPWMRQEEEAFVTDYRGVFPGPLGDAVREVANRLDLDYAGMDCTIDPAGRVVMFEANAAMLVHFRDAVSAPYREAPVARIRDAVTAMVRSRLA